MKKGLVVLIALLLLDVPTLLCHRRGESPAVRRIKSNLRKEKVITVGAFWKIIRDGNRNHLINTIKKMPQADVENYLKEVDPDGRKALSMARNAATREILVAYGAQLEDGEKRSGMIRVKSCPNIAGLCIGAVSPRSRCLPGLSVSPRSCAAEAADDVDISSPKAVGSWVNV